MSAVTTGAGVVEKRYAVSLLELAEDAGNVDAVEADIKDLHAMLESSPELGAMVASPLVSREKQADVIAEISQKAKFSPLTEKFLGVVVANRRLASLGSIVVAFQKLLRDRRGEVEARIETAFPLSPAQTESLQKELSRKLGASVTMDVEINKDLLGGLIVTVGSRMIDNSVRRKLEQLQVAMSRSEKAA